MPDGPVVISPDGLFPSLYREGGIPFPFLKDFLLYFLVCFVKVLKPLCNILCLVLVIILFFGFGIILDTSRFHHFKSLGK